MSREQETEETFSRREAEALLDAAARARPDTRSTELTRAELTEAATEAGIDPGQLDAAIRDRRGRPGRVGAAAIALGMAAITAALVLGSLRGAGSRDARWVLIHNEHRYAGFRLDVLVPRPDARDPSRCADPPSSRVAARDYCRLTRVWIAPRARLHVNVPDAPRGCPQLWVRAVDASGRWTAALFTLPAGIEIERSGRLDQKGLGSPNMHAAPDPGAGPDADADADADRAADCPPSRGAR